MLPDTRLSCGTTGDTNYPGMYAECADIEGRANDRRQAAVMEINTPEPKPDKNDGDFIWDLVIRDMKNRDNRGAEKYGIRLQAFNGRDPLVDAYQEALDLAVYLRQAIYEIRGR